MLRAILPSKKEDLREYEEVKDADEKIEITKQDVLAMIIAAFQIIMPIVFLGAVLMFLLVLLFTKIYIG